MVLSELVRLKLTLEDLLLTEIGKTDHRDFMCKISPLIDDPANSDISPYLKDAKGIIQSQLGTLNSNLGTQFTQAIAIIEARISQEAEKFLIKTYDQLGTTVEDDRANRTLPLPADIKEGLIGRIRLLSDWHYPGIEIGPHDGEFTPHLVSNDPLYIVDIFNEYLDSTKAQFNELYQARLRTYQITIDDGAPYMSMLPKNQFGMAFSWNTFNYLPFSIVTQYLTEVFVLLRPGGMFLFGFNDAATVNGAKHVEWGGMAYMTKSMIVTVAKEIGYEILGSFSKETDWHNVSWLEIKKPGQLATIKAHQTLGIIKHISE